MAAITIHGRTHRRILGEVNPEGSAVVEAVEQIPVVGSGDVRTAADALLMRGLTGCAAVAIERGALFDPWIFRRLQHSPASRRHQPAGGTHASSNPAIYEPSPAEQIDFLSRHFQLMVEQHGEFQSCRMFRKFAAWSGARLGIPEDLEDRLRRFESVVEFEQIIAEIRERHGTRRDPRPTAEVKVPNGPVEYW